MFKALRAVDHTILVANILLLLVISFIPFPTELVGEHLNRGTFADERTAVLFYGATMLAVSIVFPLLWWAMSRNRALLNSFATPAYVGSQLRRNLLGFPIYLVITAVAFVAPGLSLAGFAAVAIFYLSPSQPAAGSAP
jgi:uncharacterized membrane protein